MPRYVKNMVILAKLEATAGTDAAPTGAADAVLIADSVTITPLETKLVDRKLYLPYFGGSMQLLGSYNAKIAFSVELAGSGAAGTAPAWGDLVMACAASEAVLATPARVEYSPASTGLKTLTLCGHDDGVLHKLTGAMGTCKLSAKVGEVPRLQFEFTGVYNTATATANPTATLTAWKVPPVVNKASVVDITLGCTYAAGALTGGTRFNSTGIEIDLGNKLAFMQFLSEERVDITDRDCSAKFELELTAAQEVAALADIIANTTTSLGITLGTAAGNKHILHAPLIQRTGITKADKDGVRLVAFDAKLLPSSGNDDLRIVSL
ncbi:hypothetical protein [Leptothrix discophora]|uniref:Tail protein n=1 Tax=Leptothrix discophora TaxID=89 RepID=A0ABT9G1I3_LEPDI|nr:hypothetical protein [Leptothrix discophora]MDP4300343.1 hypothetical protein [Leptothrix discophora]